jgi:leucyl/phenylalanyl-tRNA--protein transferase
MPVFVLSEKIAFPPPHLAADEGLLAVGGDLSHERLLAAYHAGIFPWYSEDQPILWWSPDPRLVLYPSAFRISKSLRKVIRQQKFRITLDLAFEQVIHECAHIRRLKDTGTWLVDEMIQAYCRLHRYGFAHSVEAWYEQKLVGGLYGVSLGRCFFGESMFARVSNASKVAFARLVDHLKQMDFQIIDCQVKTAHLMRFGAQEVPRHLFLKQLLQAQEMPTLRGKWSFTDQFPAIHG